MRSMADVRVLVAEDDPSQQLLSRRLLEHVGVGSVRVVADPEAFVDTVLDGDPHVILLDLHLGAGDGFALVERLRDADPSLGDRRVVLVTGDTNPALADRVRASGVHGVLAKPFLVDDFVAMIEEQARHLASDDELDQVPAVHQPEARIVDVIRQLADAASMDEIAEIVRHAARDLTGADGATFILRDGDQCHYVDEDAIAPLWKGHRFPLEACVSGWAMLNRQAVTISNIYADDRVPHDAYRPTFVRSMVMVPIRTAEPVGAIGNYWATAHVATDDEVAVLQALADSTAVAIENARLYGALGSAHDDAVELRSANNQLRDFVYAVAHDVRGPLSTIQGFADLLYGHDVADPEDATAALREIRESARNLSSYLADLLAFATADGRTLQSELLSFNELMDDATTRLREPIRSRHAELIVDATGELWADRVLLGQALQNLIANAINYTPTDRDPVVRVTMRAADHGWTLEVADNGAGVPVTERTSIFDPFRRGSTGARTAGTGLGLALCRRVAERHGGRITVDDAPDGGARFRVVVPNGVPG